jgi:hypothetical protein
MNSKFKQTLLASVVAAASVGAAQAEVNLTSWGGAYTASQQKAYADTWKEGTVNFINYNGGLGEVKTQVESTFCHTKPVSVVTKACSKNWIAACSNRQPMARRWTKT